MKKDIILAGVGGQGILTIAATIGTAALSEGLQLKQAEVHGMSQRGGDVQSHLRISSKEIASDLIPEGKADLVISVEPMEALRYVNMLHKETGWLISSMNPYKNIKFKNPNLISGKGMDFKLRSPSDHRFIEIFLKQKAGDGSLYLDRLKKIKLSS